MSELDKLLGDLGESPKEQEVAIAHPPKSVLDTLMSDLGTEEIELAPAPKPEPTILESIKKGYYSTEAGQSLTNAARIEELKQKAAPQLLPHEVERQKWELQKLRNPNDVFAQMTPEQRAAFEQERGIKLKIPGEIGEPLDAPVIIPPFAPHGVQREARDILTTGAKQVAMEVTSPMASANLALLRSVLTDPSVPAGAAQEFVQMFQDEQVRDATENYVKAHRLPESSALQRVAASKDFSEAFAAFMEAPLDVVVDGLAQNAYGSSKVLAAGMGGRVLGPAGFVVGTGAESFRINYNAKFAELLAREGVDLTNPDAIYQAMQDPQNLRKISSTSAQYALPIAMTDAFTAHVAGKQLGTTTARNLTAQTGVQAVGGAGGEALGTMAAGEEQQPGEILLEGLLEVPGGIVEPVIQNPQMIFNKLRKITSKGADAGDGFIGPQLPPELQEIHEVRQKLKGALDSLAEEDIPLIDAKMRTLNELALSPINTKFDNEFRMALNGYLQNELPVQTNEGTMLLKEALQKTNEQVFVDDSPVYQDKVAELKTIHQELVQQGASVNPADLQRVEAEIEYYSNLAEAVPKVEAAAKAILLDWNESFQPGRRLVFSLDRAGRVLSELEPGHHITGSDSTVGYHIGLPDYGLITLNLEGLSDEHGVIRQGALMDALSHEYGHYITTSTFQAQPLSVQQALYNGWKNWLNDLSKTDENGKHIALEQFLKKKFPTFLGQELIRKHTAGMPVEERKQFMSRTMLALGTAKRQRYQLGFSEWVANAFAKAGGKTPIVSKATQPYFQQVHEKLKRLYQRFKDTGDRYDVGVDTFKDFLEYMAASSAYNSVHKAINNLQAGIDTDAAVNTITKNVMNVIANVSPPGDKTPGMEPSSYLPEDFKGDMDKFNKTMEYGYTLLQIARANPGIRGLQNYVETIRNWWTMKMNWTSRADERLIQWQKLGRKRSENLGKFLLDLTTASFNKQRILGPRSKIFQDLVTKWNVDAEMLTVYGEIDNDMSQVLDAVEEALLRNIDYAYRRDETGKAEAIQEVRDNMEVLRNRNFFPLSRFGKYYVTVKAGRHFTADGQTYTPGDIISFETFETERAQKKRVREAKTADTLISHGLIVDSQRAFAGLPPQFIAMLEKRLKLTEEQMAQMSPEERSLAIEQQDALQELMKDIAPGQSFIKHLKHRKNTPGFNSDAIRSYANYMFHFSNHIARIHYKGDLNAAIDQVRATERFIASQPHGATTRTQVRQYMEEHLNYMLFPGNELANLRALGFLWYLGFVPKSAIVNLTQVPLVTYPYLSARYGDIKATKALSKAMKDAALYWKRPWKLTQGQFDMLETLKRSGIIDESMATELAAVSEGSIVQRMAPTAFLKSPKAARFIRTAAGKAAWMFQQAEKANRRITALAAYDLAIQSGLNHTQAVEAASRAVDTTQYEYARFNRPKFMRNKRSVFFLFWQYKQHTLHFLFNDPGNVRFMLMLFMMAGLSGLPFAEDLMDMIDYVSRKYNSFFGKEAAPANIRRDIRDIINQLGADPDLVMHGASRYSFGLPWLGDAVGVPIPNADLSGSLSMGRVIPGIDPVFGRQGDFNERFARSTQEAAGPIVSVPIELMRAIADDNPNTLKRFERAYPTVVKSLSRAYRYATDQVEETAGGDPLAEFDIENTKHRLEIIAQGLGAAPTRVNEAKERYYMTKEIVEYYELRRRHLMMLFDYAQRTGDAAMESQVVEAIDRFNSSVPVPEFTVKAKDIIRSRKQRELRRGLSEEGIFTPKSKAGVQDYVDEAYPTKDIGGGVVEEQKDKEPSALDNLLNDL